MTWNCGSLLIDSIQARLFSLIIDSLNGDVGQVMCSYVEGWDHEAAGELLQIGIVCLSIQAITSNIHWIHQQYEKLVEMIMM